MKEKENKNQEPNLDEVVRIGLDEEGQRPAFLNQAAANWACQIFEHPEYPSIGRDSLEFDVDERLISYLAMSAKDGVKVIDKWDALEEIATMIREVSTESFMEEQRTKKVSLSPSQVGESALRAVEKEGEHWDELSDALLAKPEGDVWIDQDGKVQSNHPHHNLTEAQKEWIKENKGLDKDVN